MFLIFSGSITAILKLLSVVHRDVYFKNVISYPYRIQFITQFYAFFRYVLSDFITFKHSMLVIYYPHLSIVPETKFLS